MEAIERGLVDPNSSNRLKLGLVVALNLMSDLNDQPLKPAAYQEVKRLTNHDDPDVQEQTKVFLKRYPQTESTQPLTIHNTSEQVRNRWWKWTVFIRGPKTTLGQIDYVEYKLHPSFQPNTYRVNKPVEGPQAFRFSASGWGTFQVGVRVHYKNGDEEDFTHQLRFERVATCVPSYSFWLDQYNARPLTSAEFQDRVFVYVGNVEGNEPTRLQLVVTPSPASVPSKRLSESEFSGLFPNAQKWELSAESPGEWVGFEYRGQKYRLEITEINDPWFGTDQVELGVCRASSR